MAVFMRGQNTDRNLNLTSGSGTRAKGIIPYKKGTVYPLYVRTMLDVAETRGFASSMPKAKTVSKACLPRATHCTDRARASGNVTPTVQLCPPSLTFRIKGLTLRARRDVSEGKKKMTIIRRIHILYHVVHQKRLTSPCRRGKKRGWTSRCRVSR